MDAIKTFLFLFTLIPFIAMGQKTKYPKDTIYVKYEDIMDNKKWFGKYGYGSNEKKGILFNIKDKNNKTMSLFFHQKNNADTLCMKHLKEYKFSNLKEIRKKEIEWIDKKFKGLKYKPYSGGGIKNGAFQTYLIEIISEECFVIYPVTWRNEGVID